MKVNIKKEIGVVAGTLVVACVAVVMIAYLRTQFMTTTSLASPQNNIEPAHAVSYVACQVVNVTATAVWSPFKQVVSASPDLLYGQLPVGAVVKRVVANEPVQLPLKDGLYILLGLSLLYVIIKLTRW